MDTHHRVLNAGLTIGWLGALTSGVYSQPTEVPLQRISATSEAQHEVIVQAFGGTGWDDDHKFVSNSGTERASASTKPLELHAAATAHDPNAYALGYAENTATAGYNRGPANVNVTSAYCWRYLFVEAEEA